MALSSSASATSDTPPITWVNTFCSILGHEYFAQVTEDFIEDDFNLTGLQSQVPLYKEALEMLLDMEPEMNSDDMMEEDEEDEEDQDDDGGGRNLSYAGSRRSDIQAIESSAELLYGLIHQRFITSRQGMQIMLQKYHSQDFGFCPRVFCNQALVLPVGCSDIPGHETVKLFCPSCLDIYTPPNSRFQSVDGAFFGTTFGCLFFMTFPELEVAPTADSLRLASTHPAYAPRIDSGTGALAQSRGSKRVASGAKFQQISVAPSRTKTSRSSSLTTPADPSSAKGSTDPSEVVDLDDTQAQASSDRAGRDTPQESQEPDPILLNGMTTTNIAPGLGEGKMHEPRIYGFRLSERAVAGPRMKWLRMRPKQMRDLDERSDHVEKWGDPDDSDGQEEAVDEGVEDEEEDEGEEAEEGKAGREKTGKAKEAGDSHPAGYRQSTKAKEAGRKQAKPAQLPANSVQNQRRAASTTRSRKASTATAASGPVYISGPAGIGIPATALAKSSASTAAAGQQEHTNKTRHQEDEFSTEMDRGVG